MAENTEAIDRDTLNALWRAKHLSNRVNKEYADWYLVTHIHHFTLLHSNAQRHG